MDKELMLHIVEKAFAFLGEHPVVAGFVAPGCVLVWRTPEIIGALGQVIREGRKNKLEVKHRQEVLRRQLERSRSSRRGAKND